MNCKKCGGALGENAKFCAACGEKVTEQEALEKKVVKTAKDVSPKKKKKKGFGLIFFLLICVAILAVAVIYMRGKGISAKHEIDLGKYVSIEYEGYSGLGIASWDFEKREFFDDYEEELKFPAKLKEKAKELGEDIENIVKYCCDSADIDMDDPDEDDAAEFIYFLLFEKIYLSDSTFLTNGDQVELRWKFEKEWSEEQIAKVCELFGVSVNYDNVNWIVNGLTEVPLFDPFEGVEISYSGAAPAGKAVLANYPDNGWTYELIAPETVNNGDEIKVTISVEMYDVAYYTSQMEKYIETYGMLPSTTEKTYIVSGLPEYISSASQIPAEDLAAMQSQAEDIIDGTTYGWSGNYTLDKTYIGNYVMTAKETGSRQQNMITLVYKMHYSIFLLDHTGETKEYATDFYYYITWNNVKIKEDGTLEYDVNSYSKPDVKFRVETNIYASANYDGTPTSYSEYYFKLPGYATLDEVYNQCVTQYIEKYKLEENIVK